MSIAVTLDALAVVRVSMNQAVAPCLRVRLDMSSDMVRDAIKALIGELKIDQAGALLDSLRAEYEASTKP